MKVLFFTYDFPYPIDSGGKNRAYHLLKHTAKKVDITLFSFTRKKVTPDQIEAIEDLGIDRIFTFERRKVKSFSFLLRLLNPRASIFRKLYFDRKVLQQLVNVVSEENSNIIHFESFYTSYFLHHLFSKKGVKQVIGTENIEHWLYQNYVKTRPFFSQPLYSFEVEKIKKEEEMLLRQADATIAVTEAESVYIHSLTGKQSFVVENGIDTTVFSYYKKKKGDKRNILFVGNFSYFPNIGGINGFYNKIFLSLEKENVMLTIIGKGASRLPFANDKRIVTKEYVVDIKEEYKKTDIVISPITISGGTNFKVLEAMAFGIPVIAYRVGAKGLDAVSGKHLFLAENDTEFKEYILTVLNDDTVAENITKQARRLIEDKYDWKDIGDRLYKAWEKIV